MRQRDMVVVVHMPNKKNRRQNKFKYNALSKLSSEKEISDRIRFFNNIIFSCAVGAGIALFFYFTAPVTITIYMAFCIGGSCAAGAMLICKARNYCADRDYERMLQRESREIKKDKQDEATRVEEKLKKINKIEEMKEQTRKEGIAKKFKEHGLHYRMKPFAPPMRKELEIVAELSEDSLDEELLESKEYQSATGSKDKITHEVLSPSRGRYHYSP